MKNPKFILAGLSLLLTFTLWTGWPVPAATINTPDARQTVQAFFHLLKTRRYAELYEYLPSEMQKRISREQVAQAMQRLDTFIVIERMEIGRVQQRRIGEGDFAVIDTTLYGRLKRPAEMNGQKLESGKVVVQQYLFREGNQWKVATADGTARTQFLKRYPEFSQGFQLRPPQFFFKQDNEWKALRPERRS